MNIISKALNYIDDDLILSAYNGADAKKSRFRGGSSPRIGEWQPAQRAHGGARAVAISVAAAMLCAVIAAWAVLAFTGNHAEDPRAHGEQKILNGFEDIGAYYPDGDMAERIASLDFIEYHDEGVQLWYDVGGDWTDSNCWNSVVMSGEIEQTGQIAIVYCLFDGTYDEWASSRECYRSGAYYITIGETEVKAARQTLADGSTDSYAIFESGGVVYELAMFNCSQYAGYEEYQRSILEAMLE